MERPRYHPAELMLAVASAGIFAALVAGARGGLFWAEGVAAGSILAPPGSVVGLLNAPAASVAAVRSEYEPKRRLRGLNPIMRRLTVLYDDRCGLCSWARRWARGRPAYLELVFLAAGSAEARRRFPGLDGTGELTVISDEGGVYREGDAWIMCLYALEDYREWSLRLASPALRPLARQAFALVSGSRGRVSRWLGLLPDAELSDTLARVEAPACELSLAGGGQIAGAVSPSASTD